MNNGALDSSKFLIENEDHLLRSTLDKYHNRDTLMLDLLRTYGMRANELLNIKPKDINQVTKAVRVSGSKGSNMREFPLSDLLFERLMKEAGKCLMDDWLVFPICYVRLYQIWLFYRPVKKKLHSLRHTCAVNLYRKTKDIKLVQKVLGHRSMANTMIYVDYCYTQDEFRKALVG